MYVGHVSFFVLVGLLLCQFTYFSILFGSVLCSNISLSFFASLRESTGLWQLQVHVEVIVIWTIMFDVLPCLMYYV